VLLLREDLVEIRADGSLRILDEGLQLRVEQLQQSRQQSVNQNEGQVRARAELSEQTSQADIAAARKELDAIRLELKAQSGRNSAELSQENARLRELIERLCKESQSR
jgi:hypothetical protein